MLVIDILAGASAGGINGALLGAMTTEARELRPTFECEGERVTFAGTGLGDVAGQDL